MSEYHKIQTVWLRDPETNNKRLLEGKWAKPEFEYLSMAQWAFTEKIDGTNIRLIWNGIHGEDGSGVLTMRGKTDAAQLPQDLEKLDLTSLFAAADLPPMVIYCEGFGPKIQSGGKYRSDHGLIAFDVFCGGMWLERSNVLDIAGQLGLPVVPIIGEGTLPEMIEMVRHDFGSVWGTAKAEGVVARPLTELLNRRGERVITKVKRKDFP